MRNKCKFCGYVFKDRDESICPECLTAREEDISCGQYSDDEHSHGYFDDRYSRDSSVFSQNDIFKQEENSFLQEEIKDERKSKMAKLEAKERAEEKANRQFTPPSGNGVYNNYRNNVPTYGGMPFQRQNVNQFRRVGNMYSSNMGNTTANFANRNKNPGCAKPLAIIIALIVIANVVPAIYTVFKRVTSEKSKTYTDIENDNDNDYDYDNDTDKPYQYFPDYNYVIDHEKYPDYNSFVPQEQTSGNKKMSLDYYMVKGVRLADLTDDERECLTMTNDEHNNANTDEGYAFAQDPDAQYRISAKFTISSEDNSDFIGFDSICCRSYDKYENLISTYTIPEDELSEIFNSDNSVSVFVMTYCPAESEIIELETMGGNSEYTESYYFYVTNGEE
ncbi:MAG: hypothetical protein J5994_06765 [Ruminococcus sp.]|nr:hypothetical protein [Ruminococcus sp.]